MLRWTLVKMFHGIRYEMVSEVVFIIGSAHMLHPHVVLRKTIDYTSHYRRTATTGLLHTIAYVMTQLFIVLPAAAAAPAVSELSPQGTLESRRLRAHGVGCWTHNFRSFTLLLLACSSLIDDQNRKCYHRHRAVCIPFAYVHHENQYLPVPVLSCRGGDQLPGRCPYYTALEESEQFPLRS